MPNFFNMDPVDDRLEELAALYDQARMLQRLRAFMVSQGYNDPTSIILRARLDALSQEYLDQVDAALDRWVNLGDMTTLWGGK